MARSQEQRERYEQHAFDLEGELRPPRRIYTQADVAALHEALEPFVDLAELRRIVTDQREVREALKTDVPPKAVRALMWAVVEMLRPVGRESIRSPRDAAAYFMAALGDGTRKSSIPWRSTPRTKSLGSTWFTGDQ